LFFFFWGGGGGGGGGGCRSVGHGVIVVTEFLDSVNYFSS